MALPGLPGLPNLSLASSAASAVNKQGSAWEFGGGDWNVNLGGTGSASAVPTSISTNMLLIAAIVGALWFLRK